MSNPDGLHQANKLGARIYLFILMKGSEETGDGIFSFRLTVSYLMPFSLWLLQHSHTGGRQLDMLTSHYRTTVH